MNAFLMFFLGFFALVGQNTEVFTVDGVLHEGRITAFEPGGDFRFEEEAGGIASIDIRDIHLIQFPVSISMDHLATPAFIELVDRSLFAGEVRGGDEESLLFVHPLLGSLRIPIERLSTLVSDSPEMPRDLMPYPEAREDDVLYKRGTHRRGKDYIPGTLVEFTGQGVVFDCRLGELRFAYGELEALSLFQERYAKTTEGIRAWIVLKQGTGIVRGRIKSFGPREATIAVGWTDDLTIPYDKIGAITLESPRYQALSDLEPADVEERSYIQGAGDRFLYPYMKDRSVTGRWLESSKRIFARGLGIHSRTRLTYALDDRYQAFETFIGLSDEVLDLPARGSIRFDVFVDDARVYSSPVIRGGDGVVRIPRIDLSGARKLSLLVDFADRFDSGDRAILGQPILIRKKTSAD